MARSNLKTRIIPESYREKTMKSVPGAVVYISKDGLSAKGFFGKSVKAEFFFRFPTKDNCKAYVANFFDKKRTLLKERAERAKKVASFKHGLKVGDIVYSSWGWEQTNIDFYEVVAVPSDKTVRLRELKAVRTESSPLAMSGTTVPLPNEYASDEILLKKVGPGYRDGMIWVNFKYGGGSKWDGKPMSCSWYA
jgi:hypothetical protein